MVIKVFFQCVTKGLRFCSAWFCSVWQLSNQTLRHFKDIPTTKSIKINLFRGRSYFFLPAWLPKYLDTPNDSINSFNPSVLLIVQSCNDATNWTGHAYKYETLRQQDTRRGWLRAIPKWLSSRDQGDRQTAGPLGRSSGALPPSTDDLAASRVQQLEDWCYHSSFSLFINTCCWTKSSAWHA